VLSALLLLLIEGAVLLVIQVIRSGTKRRRKRPTASKRNARKSRNHGPEQAPCPSVDRRKDRNIASVKSFIGWQAEAAESGRSNINAQRHRFTGFDTALSGPKPTTTLFWRLKPWWGQPGVTAVGSIPALLATKISQNTDQLWRQKGYNSLKI